MKVSRSKLKQIIKEEIYKVHEGIKDLDLSGTRAAATALSDLTKGKKNKKKGKPKKGMTRTAAIKYAKSYLKEQSKDPDVLNNHKSFKAWIRQNAKTTWKSKTETDIKNRIESWINRNILNQVPTPQPTETP